MTIYWNPVEDDENPDTIDVWFVQDDGTQHDIGPADVSGVSGMRDSLGGVAPDAVRAVVADYKFSEMSPGNSPSHSQASTQAGRDMDKLDYVRGTPP